MPDISSCACSECQAMCQQRPCWPTPADAQRLIKAGHADQLMVDWWFDKSQGKSIYLLTPAILGWEARVAPIHPQGRCTFLDEQNLCRLHDCGLKPTEGQLALCQNRSPAGLHEQIGQSWDNATGRNLVYQWESAPPRGRHLALISGRQ